MSKTALSILLFILLLGAFFRFYQIIEIPLGLYPDEAMNGNNALEALATGDFKIFYPENNGREGLFINLQAISLAVFGNEAWALRFVSAIFGTLTILSVFLLAKELLKSDFNSRRGPTSIALLSSFFLATSYWHINFSRIGFRAIMVPFFAAFGIYFLLKGLRRMNLWDMVWAGVFIGLGFHTYIAFRFMPFVIAVPIGWYLWSWHKNRKSSLRAERSNPDHLEIASSASPSRNDNLSCIPCLIALFLFVTFVIALPIGYYFLQNPQDFLGRGGQVSIFAAESPLFEFAKSNLATLGMFFVPGRGDCNWRHNLDCKPYLPIGVLSALGIWSLWRWRQKKELLFLLGWALFMSLPATLTREGLPHALRSIGMIPPLMVLEGVGAWSIVQAVFTWIEKQKNGWPERLGQLNRLKKEFAALFILILLFIPLYTYWQYFVRWAYNPNTYFAFSTDLLHLGQYLDKLPPDTQKYVIVNLPGVEVRGIPMPAQTVMFATDTLREDRQRDRNIIYLNPYRGKTSIVETIEVLPLQKTVIAFLNGEDRALIAELQKKYPELKVRVPGDFVILQNY